MATTYDRSLTFDAGQRSKTNLFNKIFQRFIESRQKEANRQILIYLQSLDAESLRSFGYTDAQIEHILGPKSKASQALTA